MIQKPASNFDLLSDFSSIPQSVSPGTHKPVNIQQKDTQSILQQVNQISQTKNTTKLLPLRQTYINSIFATALPTDQLRCKNQTHAAARCCPAKNRQNGAIPFDENRLRLQNVSNDYINCSRVSTGNHTCENRIFVDIFSENRPKTRQTWPLSKTILVKLSDFHMCRSDAYKATNSKTMKKGFLFLSEMVNFLTNLLSLRLLSPTSPR